VNSGIAGFPKKRSRGLDLIEHVTLRHGDTAATFLNIRPDIYDDYRLIASGVTFSAAGGGGHLLFSVNGGATWSTAAGNSNYAAWVWTHSPTGAFGDGNGGAFPVLFGDNDAGWSNACEFSIMCHPGVFTTVSGITNGHDSNRGTNDPEGLIVDGVNKTTQRVNAVRLSVSTGVFLTGQVALYGYYRGIG
jgi:hypothetical protein